jgi:hypothetical protein
VSSTTVADTQLPGACSWCVALPKHVSQQIDSAAIVLCVLLSVVIQTCKARYALQMKRSKSQVYLGIILAPVATAAL